MTTIDLVFMSVLCYVLGLLLGVIPGATAAYWKLAGLCYLAKTLIWMGLRIPLLLPIDRWIKRGMPPEDNDPALVRSIYYFPYDFSLFYGLLIFGFYASLMGLMVFSEGPVQIHPDLLLPGLLFASSLATGAVAIGVPVNLLLTAKFSRRLAEREAKSFSDIPGKQISLQTKMATVAIALGCAPSLLLFSIQSFMQYDGLYQEAERTALMVAKSLRSEPEEGFYRWAVLDAYPFILKDGNMVFVGEHRPTDAALALLRRRDVTLRIKERRMGYVLRYSPNTKEQRGVFVRIPEPRNNFLAISLVILLACLWPLITSVLTVQTIVKPVAVIAAIFHKIIGRGRTDDSDRVPLVYKDEVGRLAFNANRTINILTEARSQLEESSRNLAEKNRELQAAYRTKGEFLANMSHELRTPLNAIIGFSRLMKRKLSDTMPERQMKNLELIQQSGEQLLVLVNDLLDFEKIEAGKLTIRREEVDLKDLLDSLSSTLRPSAQDKGLKLSFEVGDIATSIHSDRDRLRQVLTNLLTNGIKYSDRGTVLLKVYEQEQWLVFQVTDEGIGMSPDQIEKIFDPFHQVDGSETRERGGVGLGLAIVGRLVGLLRGLIEVSSVKGKGSTFTVKLPLEMTTNHLEPQGDGAPILVVDDNIDYLESIYSELSEAGFRVTVARSGVEALECLETYTPQVILLDIVMPEMDGWEVLRRLRQREGLREIPVIVTSVVDERPVGMDIEIAGWLNKPIELESLRDLLNLGEDKFTEFDGRLIVVEDDQQTAQLLEQSFEEAGVKPRVAFTEDEARLALDESLPSVLILDLNLEQGSGWSVLSYLRTLPGHEKTKVYVYTAADLGDKERARLNQNLVTIVHKHGSDSLGELVSSILKSS